MSDTGEKRAGCPNCPGFYEHADLRDCLRSRLAAGDFQGVRHVSGQLRHLIAEAAEKAAA